MNSLLSHGAIKRLSTATKGLARHDMLLSMSTFIEHVLDSGQHVHKKRLTPCENQELKRMGHAVFLFNVDVATLRMVVLVPTWKRDFCLKIMDVSIAFLSATTANCCQTMCMSSLVCCMVWDFWSRMRCGA